MRSLRSGKSLPETPPVGRAASQISSVSNQDAPNETTTRKSTRTSVTNASPSVTSLSKVKQSGSSSEKISKPGHKMTKPAKMEPTDPEKAKFDDLKQLLVVVKDENLFEKGIRDLPSRRSRSSTNSGTVTSKEPEKCGEKTLSKPEKSVDKVVPAKREKSVDKVVPAKREKSVDKVLPTKREKSVDKVSSTKPEKSTDNAVSQSQPQHEKSSDDKSVSKVEKIDKSTTSENTRETITPRKSVRIASKPALPPLPPAIQTLKSPISKPHPVPKPSPVKIKATVKPKSSSASRNRSPPKTPIVCLLCPSKTFTRKAHLDRHLKLHTGEKPFMCDVCKSTFARRDHMLCHRQKHHGDANTTDSNMSFGPEDLPNVTHPKPIIPQASVPTAASQNLVCETCGKIFLQKRYLQAHRKLHLREYVGHMDYSELRHKSRNGGDRGKKSVEDLSKSISSISVPNRIMSTVVFNEELKQSTGEATLSQKDANFNFQEQSDLGNEQEALTNYDSEVEDVDLGYETVISEGDSILKDSTVSGYKDTGSLRTHNKYIRKKKKYVCRYFSCTAVLASAGSLRRHGLLHTHRKEFRCKVCLKNYSRQDNLNVHMKAHERSANPYMSRNCIQPIQLSPTRKISTAISNNHEAQAAYSSPSASNDNNVVISLIPDSRNLARPTEDQRTQSSSFKAYNVAANLGRVKPEPLEYQEEEEMASWPPVEQEMVEGEPMDLGNNYTGNTQRSVGFLQRSSNSAPPPLKQRPRGRYAQSLNSVDTRPFGCKLCPQRFNHRSNLSRHVRLLHNSGQKNLPNQVSYQRFVNNIHQKGTLEMEMPLEQSMEVVEDEIPSSSDWKSWQNMAGNPALLKTRTIPVESLRQGVQLTAEDSAMMSFSLDPNSSRPYSCNVCQKAFENKSNLWTHTRIHNKAFSCFICGLRTATQGDLILHHRTHTGERPYGCNLCEWKFSRKSALNKHVQKYHTNGAKIARPWKYKDDTAAGNLKFRFVRSNSLKDGFKMQHLQKNNNQKNPALQIGDSGQKLQNLLMEKALPRLAPAPNLAVLKSALQGPAPNDRFVQGGIPTRPNPNLQTMPPTSRPSVPRRQFNNPPVQPAQKPDRRPSSQNAIFLCRKCNKVITGGKLNYIEHIKTMHPSVSSPLPALGALSNPPKRELYRKSQKMEISATTYNCNLCGQYFPEKDLLGQHMLKHTTSSDSDATRCEVCGKICSSLGFLSRHYQYVHPEMFNPAESARFRQTLPVYPQVVMEDVEDAEGGRQGQFNRPQLFYQRDMPKQRSATSRNNTNEFGEELSASSRSSEMDDLTPCNLCKKEFLTKKARSDHIWYCKREKIHRCPIRNCNKEFKLKHDVVRHLKRHLNDKRFECITCNERFYHKQELDGHLKTVHSVALTKSPFPCDFCEMQYTSQDKLNGHMLSTHGFDLNDLDAVEATADGEHISDNDKSDLNPRDEQDAVDEDLNDDGITDPANFLEQSMEHSVSEDPSEVEHRCNPCNKTFQNRQKYMLHQQHYHTREVTNKVHVSPNPMAARTVSSSHPLSILKTTLVTNSGEDEEIEHPVPSSCVSTRMSDISSSCNKSKAVSQTHSPIVPRRRPFPVGASSYPIDNSKDINERSQTNEKSPEELDLSGLLKDQKAASGQKYYQNRELKHLCSHCGARFKQNSDLQRHMRINHNPANPKTSIHCDHCGRSFTDERYLRMHIRRYHSNANNETTPSSSTESRRSAESGDRMMETRNRLSNAKIKEEPLDYEEEQEENYDGNRIGKWNANEHFVDLTVVENDAEASSIIEKWGSSSTTGNNPQEQDNALLEDSEEVVEEIVYLNCNKKTAESSRNTAVKDQCSVTCRSCGNTLQDTNAIHGHICTPNGPRAHSSRAPPRSTSLMANSTALKSLKIVPRKVTTSQRPPTTISSNSKGSTPEHYFMCKHCPLTFARSNELLLHSRTHTGVKPFACKYCKKTYGNRSELNIHLQTEHDESMEIYYCPCCPSTFHVKKSLDSHKRRHHGKLIQFYKCQCGIQFTSQRFLDAHQSKCKEAVAAPVPAVSN